MFAAEGGIAAEGPGPESELASALEQVMRRAEEEASRVVQEARERASSLLAEAEEEGRKRRGEAEEQARRLLEEARERAGSLLRAAGEVLETARKQAEEVVARARERAHQFLRDVEEEVVRRRSAEEEELARLRLKAEGLKEAVSRLEGARAELAARLVQASQALGVEGPRAGLAGMAEVGGLPRPPGRTLLAEREVPLSLPFSERQGPPEVLALRDSSLFRAGEDILRRSRELLGLEEERALLQGQLDSLAEERFAWGLLDLVEETRRLGGKDAAFLAEEAGVGKVGALPTPALPSARELALGASTRLMAEIRKDLEATGPSGEPGMIRAMRRGRHRLLPAWSQDLASSAYFAGFVEEAWSRGMGLVWVVGTEGSCPGGVCRANAAEGPRAPGVRFASGAWGPPAHPGCRCALLPVTPGVGGGETDDFSNAGVRGGTASGGESRE